MNISLFAFLRAKGLLLALAGYLFFVNNAAMAQSGFDDPGSGVSGTAGDIVAVEPKIDAGEVALGSSSQVVVLFRNDDSKPINISDTQLYPSSNVSAAIAQDQCSVEPLMPQAVCAMAFAVKGLQSGRFRIEILIKHDGRRRLLTASITGSVDVADNSTGDRNTDIEVLPEEIAFGSISGSGAQVKSALLRNITSQTLEVEDISIRANPRSGFELEHECGELPSGGACVISVTWAPEQVGAASGTILVRHSGPTGMASIDLSGTFSPSSASEAPLFSESVPGKGLLVSSLSQVDFGSGIEKTSSITVSLVNAGDAPLSLTNLILSNTENGISIEKKGCVRGRVLEPIEACPLTLTWTPVREGNVLDDLQISHTGARGLLVLPVRGTATKAVSKDSQAIVLGDYGRIPMISVRDVEETISTTPSGKSSSASSEQSEDTGEVEESAEEGGTPTVSRRTQSLSDYQVVDVRGVLDGYKITSLTTNRAIINGPGGSRVVMDGENTVIGGVPWVVEVKPSAVQFTHNDQSIVLLFDKSLSFINQSTSQSSGSTSTTSGP